MKKFLLFLTCIGLLYAGNSYSQATFKTGGINAEVSDWGNVSLYTPDAIRYLDLASILVAVSPTEVFDWVNDARSKDPMALVTTPSLSDFEIHGSIDDSAFEHHTLEVNVNAYGWTNQAYTIVKFSVENKTKNAINASIGLEIIPSIGGEYGYDTVTYNNTEGVIRFHYGHYGQTFQDLGIKLISASLTSLYSFEWSQYYQYSADYWTLMNKGTLQPEYISYSQNGPVAITSQAPVSIGQGESFDVYYAMALGANEQIMLSNISAAMQKYPSLTYSVRENQLAAAEFKNYPNPVKFTTTISYQLPGNGNVSLKVYDALGNERAVLVNEKQTKGFHTIDYDAKDLASGVYSYRLIYNDQFISNQMVLIK